MSRASIRDVHDPQARELAKILERVSPITGHGMSRVFEDWVEVSLAAIEALPTHLQYAVREKRLATADEEPPHVKKKWEEIKGRYNTRASDVFAIFAEAFGFFLNTVQDEDGTIIYNDLIGQIFCVFSGNSALGQFFTPFSVSKMMAMMTCDGIFESRFREALAKSEIASAMAMACGILSGDDASLRHETFFRYIAPLVKPHFEPITILDPCVGSGGMLIAAAECFPAWAVQAGWVKMIGVDIDPRCVAMTRLNLLARGLDGFVVKCAEALTPEELASLPDLYRQAYGAAQTEMARGDTEMVEAIEVAVRSGQLEQIQLLNIEPTPATITIRPRQKSHVAKPEANTDVEQIDLLQELRQ